MLGRVVCWKRALFSPSPLPIPCAGVDSDSKYDRRHCRATTLRCKAGSWGLPPGVVGCIHASQGLQLAHCVEVLRNWSQNSCDQHLGQRPGSFSLARPPSALGLAVCLWGLPPGVVWLRPSACPTLLEVGLAAGCARIVCEDVAKVNTLLLFFFPDSSDEFSRAPMTPTS
ncbi:hypothetical protein SCHPADRAFT_91754 [Schizopora paradoxa]|uniref:Uncharacterized protein n=1 Tax=Schizopora paradoxa TaxID=27342 RepID=A0A0H2S4F4_9AGAM|nr:hypothetical protein SCHPADRAFT_91754 [Schizopora paradoxa]